MPSPSRGGAARRGGGGRDPRLVPRPVPHRGGRVACSAAVPPRPVLHALLAGVEGIDRFIAAEHDLTRANAVLRRFKDQPLRTRAGRKLSLTVARPRVRAGLAGVRQGADGLPPAGLEVSLRRQPARPPAASPRRPCSTVCAASGAAARRTAASSACAGRSCTASWNCCRRCSGACAARRRADSIASIRELLRGEAMGRTLGGLRFPAGSYMAAGLRRYPALLVLDANIGVRHRRRDRRAPGGRRGYCRDHRHRPGRAAQRGARKEFAFRRFEEFSPPAPAGYAYTDEQGRVFRGLFAVRGQDARERSSAWRRICIASSPRSCCRACSEPADRQRRPEPARPFRRRHFRRLCLRTRRTSPFRRYWR